MMTERWWVIFTDRHQGGLMHWFTCEGFRHCLAFKVIHSGQLLFVEPTSARMVIVASGGWAWTWLKEFCRLGCRIVVVERSCPIVPVDDGTVPRVGPLLTCASVVAYAIGIEGWVMTPKQLYDRLIRDYGGKEIKP